MKSSRVIAVFLTVSLFAGLFILPTAAQQASILQINEAAEAESGLLSADTSTPALNNASGGKAVSFGGARHDNELETIGPDLTFTVDIEKGDAYALWGKFWTTSAGNDSVYYAFDDTNYIQIDPKNTDDFEWILIGTDYLEAGTHTINFKRRETAACLIRFASARWTASMQMRRQRWSKASTHRQLMPPRSAVLRRLKRETASPLSVTVLRTAAIM